MLSQLLYWHVMFFPRTGFICSGSVLPAQPMPINSVTIAFYCCLGWQSTHEIITRVQAVTELRSLDNCSFLSPSSCRTWWWLSIWWQRWSSGSCLCTRARNWRRLPFWWWWAVDSWRRARYQLFNVLEHMACWLLCFNVVSGAALNVFLDMLGSEY